MALKSNLGKLAAALTRAADAAAEQGAKRVKEERDPRTPVDTSGLLNSGKVDKIADGVWSMNEGEGLDDARAFWMEFGNSRVPAQPHMIPAAEIVRGEMKSIVGSHVKKAAKDSAL